MSDQDCSACDCIQGRKPCWICRNYGLCRGTCDCCQKYRDERARRIAEEKRNVAAFRLGGSGSTLNPSDAAMISEQQTGRWTRYTVRRARDANNLSRRAEEGSARPYVAGVTGGSLHLSIEDLILDHQFRSLFETAGPISYAGGSSRDITDAASESLEAGRSSPTSGQSLEPRIYQRPQTAMESTRGRRNLGWPSASGPDIFHGPSSTIQNFPRNNSSGAPSTGTTIDVTRMFTGVKEATVNFPSAEVHRRAGGFVTRFPTIAEIRGVQEEMLIFTQDEIAAQISRYIYVFATTGELSKVICSACYALNVCDICGGYPILGCKTFCRHMFPTVLKPCLCRKGFGRSSLLVPHRLYFAEPDCTIRDILTTLDARSIALLRTRRYTVEDRRVEVLPITPESQQIICDPIQVTLNVKCHFCTNIKRAEMSEEDDTMTFMCCICGFKAYLPLIHYIQDPHPGHIPLLGSTEGASTSADAGTTRQRRSCDMVRQIVHSRLHVRGLNEGASTSTFADKIDELMDSEAATQDFRYLHNIQLPPSSLLVTGPTGEPYPLVIGEKISFERTTSEQQQYSDILNPERRDAKRKFGDTSPATSPPTGAKRSKISPSKRTARKSARPQQSTGPGSSGSIQGIGSSCDVRPGGILKNIPPCNPLGSNVPGRQKWYCKFCRCNSQYICSRCQNVNLPKCIFCIGKKLMRV